MTATTTADAIVQQLALVPHPEGGFYRETYRSTEMIATPRGPRPASTAIHFLVTRGAFSSLHRIASDEGWFFHRGGPLRVVVIGPDGSRRDVVLGNDLGRGEVPQAIVPAGAWFGAMLDADHTDDHALVSCTVAPGFDFADFELAARSDLLALFPQHEEIIRALTR